MPASPNRLGDGQDRRGEERQADRKAGRTTHGLRCCTATARHCRSASEAWAGRVRRAVGGDGSEWCMSVGGGRCGAAGLVLTDGEGYRKRQPRQPGLAAAGQREANGIHGWGMCRVSPAECGHGHLALGAAVSAARRRFPSLGSARPVRACWPCSAARAGPVGAGIPFRPAARMLPPPPWASCSPADKCSDTRCVGTSASVPVPAHWVPDLSGSNRMRSSGRFCSYPSAPAPPSTDSNSNSNSNSNSDSDSDSESPAASPLSAAASRPSRLQTEP